MLTAALTVDELTNPVIAVSGLQNFAGTDNDTKVLFTDCDGVEITGTCIAGCGTQLVNTPGMGWSGDPAFSIQLSGTFDCINVTFDVPDGDDDSYTFNVGTCLGADLPPPCVECPADNAYRYISLNNATGKVVGSTADVNLNGVLYGTATILETSVTNPDISGVTFGGYDNDGGTLLLQVELCEAIEVQQLDVIGLETESQIWIGNSLSGNTPEGITLEACGGTKATMLPTGSMVTNTSSSCANQGNGKYTVTGGLTTDILYFRYTNPAGGCSTDKLTFRVATCVPDVTEAIPECPLTVVTLVEDEAGYEAALLAGGTGASFEEEYIRDANGIYFDRTCANIENQTTRPDGMGGIIMGNMINVEQISPCATLVGESDCTFCDPPPPCVECPMGADYNYLNLDETGVNADDLPIGIIEVDGVCIGSYEFEFSDLDIREDGRGTTFGGFDNDGGTMLLRVDFCDPTVINQLDIRNLEVESMVSIGTMASGTGAENRTMYYTTTNGDTSLSIRRGSSKLPDG